MTQSLFFAPSDAWRSKIRRRLELLEDHRLGTPEAVLAAFFRNRDVFRPEAHQRIEAALRLYDEPPSGLCLTCGTALPDRLRYFCSTLCEQGSHLVIRPLRQAKAPPRQGKVQGLYSV